MACHAGHENNMKTSLSAALFLLAETTNSRETRRDEESRKERVRAPRGHIHFPST